MIILRQKIYSNNGGIFKRAAKGFLGGAALGGLISSPFSIELARGGNKKGAAINSAIMSGLGGTAMATASIIKDLKNRKKNKPQEVKLTEEEKLIKQKYVNEINYLKDINSKIQEENNKLQTIVRDGGGFEGYGIDDFIDFCYINTIPVNEEFPGAGINVLFSLLKDSEYTHTDLNPNNDFCVYYDDESDCLVFEKINGNGTSVKIKEIKNFQDFKNVIKDYYFKQILSQVILKSWDNFLANATMNEDCNATKNDIQTLKKYYNELIRFLKSMS